MLKPQVQKGEVFAMNKKTLLIVILAMVLLLLASCAEQQADPPAQPQPPQQEDVAPELTSSEQDEKPEPEYTQETPQAQRPIPDEIAQIYYDFFSSFEIIEYESIFGPGALLGHNTQGELRLTKIVFINQIEGIDNPVLILAEFTLEEDGITVYPQGFVNAYLIRNGQLQSNLSDAEFDAIFRPVSDGRGWDVRHQDRIMPVDINGEILFFLDFAGDVRTDGSMDIVLDWLRVG